MSDSGPLTFREGCLEFDGIDPRRGVENTFLSAKAREGARRTPFIHEGPLRTTENTFFSAKAREGARRTPFFDAGRDGKGGN